MLRAILNKSWRQHPTRHQLYDYLPPITKTIQARRTRHTEHCWRSKDELISDVLLWTAAKAKRPARTYIQQLCEDTGCTCLLSRKLFKLDEPDMQELIRDLLLWTPTHGRAKAGRPARTYIQQLCEDTGCCPEDLPEAMNDREKWRERVRDIRATSTTSWWWWYSYGYRDSSTNISHSYQKSWLIWSSSWLSNPCFGVSLPTDCLEVSFLTDHFGVWLLTNYLLTDWRLSSFRSSRFSRTQLFV